MKKFLFVLRDGKSFGSVAMQVAGELPTFEEIQFVMKDANSNRKGNFVVVDFKEIAND